MLRPGSAASLYRPAPAAEFVDAPRVAARVAESLGRGAGPLSRCAAIVAGATAEGRDAAESAGATASSSAECSEESVECWDGVCGELAEEAMDAASSKTCCTCRARCSGGGCAPRGCACSPGCVCSSRWCWIILTCCASDGAGMCCASDDAGWATLPASRDRAKPRGAAAQAAGLRAAGSRAAVASGFLSGWACAGWLVGWLGAGRVCDG